MKKKDINIKGQITVMSQELNLKVTSQVASKT